LNVGPLEQLLSISKPNKLPIQSEVQRNQSAVQQEKYVFAFTLYALNEAVCGKLRQSTRRLRLHRDGMKNVDATNVPALNERPQRAYHSFHFRQFRHRCEKKIRILA